MQISDEMVERAARELANIDGNDFDSNLMSDHNRGLYRKRAARVLTAALAGHVVVPREPTAEMIQAGDEANPTQWNDGTDYGFISDVSYDVYRAMIDAVPPVSRGE